MSTKKVYIVIGTSAAGLAAVQKIRQLDPLGRILCFSDEAELPYNKCFLADFLGDRTSVSRVYTKPAEFFQIHSVELYLGVAVLSINRVDQVITCSNGQAYQYSALLLAVGAVARKPLCTVQEGTEGLFSFHTLRDTHALKAFMAQKKITASVVLGAGLTGLEVADALYEQGHKVTVVEQQPRVLMRHVDEEAAEYLVRSMERCSVRLLTGVAVHEIVSNEGGFVEAVRLSNNEYLQTSLMVAALGAVARLELPESVGLAMQQGGVVTDDCLKTSDPAIFAAGDVALVRHALTGEKMRSSLWPDAVSQGMHAACAMTGQPKSYRGILPVATSTFFGTSFHSAGFLEPSGSGWSQKVERTDRGYAKVILDEQGIVKGFICLGDLVSKTLAYKRSLVSVTPLI